MWRTFVLRHTRRRRLPLAPQLRLHLADDPTLLWQLTRAALGAADPPLPFWAFAWAGGLAIARYLLDHPRQVAGRRVLDLAAGSGLCGIAALKAGAACALAADIDPFARAAVALNARANGVHLPCTGRDLLDGLPPPADLILAGDVCYEGPMAARMLAWLAAAHTRGSRVLIGDPGRPYFPRHGLIRLAEYRLPTSRAMEGHEITPAGVFTFSAPPRP